VVPSLFVSSFEDMLMVSHCTYAVNSAIGFSS
jgi:hypothetical protein